MDIHELNVSSRHILKTLFAGASILMLMATSGCTSNSTAVKEKFATAHVISADAITRQHLGRVIKNENYISDIDIGCDSIIVNTEEKYKIQTVVKGEYSSIAHYKLVYTSSDTSVFTIDQAGIITPIAEGKAIVTIRDVFSEIEVSYSVEVHKMCLPEIIEVNTESIEFFAGEEQKIVVNILPEDSEIPILLWSSSDETVATVDDDGNVKAIGIGECTVRVEVQNNKELHCNIAVTVLTKMNSDNLSHSGSSSNGGMNNTKSDDESNKTSGNSQTNVIIPSANNNISNAQAVLDIMNQRRLEVGLNPLTMNTTLMSGAEIRGNEIATLFSHQRPDGRDCFTAFNVTYSVAGENIAAGQPSPESVMEAWMNSTGHRENILNPSFTQVAIVCIYIPGSTYGYYWVQLFIG